MQKKLNNLLKKSRQAKGFTLIEMVVVIAIIAFLILLIAPNLMTQKDKAHERTDEAFRSTLQAQVELADDKNITLEKLESQGFISKKQAQEAKDKGITISDGRVSAPSKK